MNWNFKPDNLETISLLIKREVIFQPSKELWACSKTYQRVADSGHLIEMLANRDLKHRLKQSGAKPVIAPQGSTSFEDRLIRKTEKGLLLLATGGAFGVQATITDDSGRQRQVFGAAPQVFVVLQHQAGVDGDEEITPLVTPDWRSLVWQNLDGTISLDSIDTQIAGNPIKATAKLLYPEIAQAGGDTSSLQGTPSPNLSGGIMSFGQIDRRIDEIPRNSRPGLGFSIDDTGRTDGLLNIHIDRTGHKVPATNVIGFTAFGGDVFVAHLNSQRLAQDDFTPDIYRVTASGELIEISRDDLLNQLPEVARELNVARSETRNVDTDDSGGEAGEMVESLVAGLSQDLQVAVKLKTLARKLEEIERGLTESKASTVRSEVRQFLNSIAATSFGTSIEIHSGLLVRSRIAVEYGEAVSHAFARHLTNDLVPEESGLSDPFDLTTLGLSEETMPTPAQQKVARRILEAFIDAQDSGVIRFNVDKVLSASSEHAENLLENIFGVALDLAIINQHLKIEIEGNAINRRLANKMLTKLRNQKKIGAKLIANDQISFSAITFSPNPTVVIGDSSEAGILFDPASYAEGSDRTVVYGTGDEKFISPATPLATGAMLLTTPPDQILGVSKVGNAYHFRNEQFARGVFSALQLMAQNIAKQAISRSA